MPPRNTDFALPRRLRLLYEAAIKRAVYRVLPPKQFVATDPELYLHSIAQASHRYDLQEAAVGLARRMVGWVNTRNAATWRAAANRSQRSQLFHRLLQTEMQGGVGDRTRQLVRENSQMISSIPSKVAEQLSLEVLRAQQRGARPSTINKILRTRLPQLTRTQVNRLGRTNTQQASTALTHARCDELDISWYQWESSKDQRTRKSHRKMHGVLVPWTQPPDPEALIGEQGHGHYHAGDDWNCRCTPIVVLSADDISWPARVYWRGSIKRITKAQFANLNRRGGAAA